jgi:hypothetical protein
MNGKKFNHFDNFVGKINNPIISKHFKKEAPDFDVNLVLDNKHEHFTRLHKFEKQVKGNDIFRALREKTHYVYVITPEKKLIFLRAFKNFKKYEKYLGDDKERLKEIELSLS